MIGGIKGDAALDQHFVRPTASQAARTGVRPTPQGKILCWSNAVLVQRCVGPTPVLRECSTGVGPTRRSTNTGFCPGVKK